MSLSLLFALSSFAQPEVVADNNLNESASTVDLYVGKLRVYIVEPVSRWTNAWDVPFKNAAFDIPLSQALWLHDDEVESYTFEWTGNPWYPDVQPDNLKMIAAVFNDASYIRYSHPPDQNPFEVRHSDAAAAATPFQPGMNEAWNGFTHTVFTEEITGTY